MYAAVITELVQKLRMGFFDFPDMQRYIDQRNFVNWGYRFTFMVNSGRKNSYGYNSKCITICPICQTNPTLSALRNPDLLYL